MPLWSKIVLITLIGSGLAFGAYSLVTRQLDAEHKRQIYNLVVDNSRLAEPVNTDTVDDQDSDTTQDETTNPDKSSSINPDDILSTGQQIKISDNSENRLDKRPVPDLAIEIGVITIERVEFRVGESWESDDGLTIYTVKQIIQTPTELQMYYETQDGTEYVFIMEQTANGSYQVQSNNNIVLDVNTDPDNLNGESSKDSETDNQTLNNSNNTNPNEDDNTNSDNNTTADNTNNTSTGDNPNGTSNNNDPEPVYVIVDTSDPNNTGDDDSSENTSPNNPTPPNPNNSLPEPVEDPDDNQDPVTFPTPTSTPDGTTENNSNTPRPTPYSDGTYNFKADPQFVPYQPPLYDRDNSEDLGLTY